MEIEYLIAGIDFWVYVVIVVVGWIFQLYKKQKDKEKKYEGNFLDDEPPKTAVPIDKDFDVILKKFSNELKRDMRNDMQVKEVVTKKEPMVNSLAELKSKYGNSTIMTDADRDPDKRFDDYELQEKNKNVFADMLDDSENFKKAFILSEILKRKEY